MVNFQNAADRFRDELRDVALPAVALIEREMRTPEPIVDIDAAVADAMTAVSIAAGEIAIGVGSRGIARIDEIVRALVRELRSRGARPFIVPAMGSHGASTAQGQVEVLAHLGVTEARIGAPIRATMATVSLGKTTGGVEVFMDAHAARADAIAVVNRVKPHTSFRGPIESGPAKMLGLGLGKQDGARSIHSRGWSAMRENVPAAARVVIDRGKVSFALAIVENANEQPCQLRAIAGDEILAAEPGLIEDAKANLATLPLDTIDVLVVDQVGKNISGGGADPNVTGRYPNVFMSGGPKVTRLVYLSMTRDSDGNGNGIGLADIVSQDLASHWDPLPTYLNALTTTAAENSRLPMVMPTKELAVKAALRMCPALDPREAILIRVQDTLHLKRLWMSPRAVAAMQEPYETRRNLGSMDLSKRIRVVADAPVVSERVSYANHERIDQICCAKYVALGH
ncbi:MAG: lactate racemase domain-containing protein [Vulcanimicrobiaceae bacterium]